MVLCSIENTVIHILFQCQNHPLEPKFYILANLDCSSCDFFFSILKFTKQVPSHLYQPIKNCTDCILKKSKLAQIVVVASEIHHRTTRETSLLQGLYTKQNRCWHHLHKIVSHLKFPGKHFCSQSKELLW